MQSEKRWTRGAINVATRSSFRLNPQSAMILATPNMNTFDAFPVENPPPINEAERVAKMIRAGYCRWTTEYSFRLRIPRPAQSPKAKMPPKYKTTIILSSIGIVIGSPPVFKKLSKCSEMAFHAQIVQVVIKIAHLNVHHSCTAYGEHGTL